MRAMLITGNPGSGKSTLVHILLGLLQPSGGSVTLSGHQMTGVALETWRRLMGYVPQETMFFHASVAQRLEHERDVTRLQREVAQRDGQVRHASQLYEAGLEGLVLFAVLWTFTRKPRWHEKQHRRAWTSSASAAPRPPCWSPPPSVLP